MSRHACMAPRTMQARMRAKEPKNFTPIGSLLTMSGSISALRLCRSDELLEEASFIDIEHDMHLLLAQAGMGGFGPDMGDAVILAMVDIDIHIGHYLFGHQRAVDRNGGGQLVPHRQLPRMFGQQLGGR